MLDRSINDAWIDWLKKQRWDFFVTLDLNRVSNKVTAERHFREFCQRLDRRVLGPGWNRASARRTLVVAVPEHTSSNFHFHCLVRQRGNFGLPLVRIETHIAEAWESVLKGGSCDVQGAGDIGRRASYMSKELWKEENYHIFLISPERTADAAPATGGKTGAGNASDVNADAVGNLAEFESHLRTGRFVQHQEVSAKSAAMEVAMSKASSKEFYMKASKYFASQRRKVERHLQKSAGSAQCRAIIGIVENVARRLNKSAKWRKHFDHEADKAGIPPTRTGGALHLRLMKVLGIQKAGATMNRWCGHVACSLRVYNSAAEARAGLLRNGVGALSKVKGGIVGRRPFKIPLKKHRSPLPEATKASVGRRPFKIRLKKHRSPLPEATKARVGHRPFKIRLVEKGPDRRRAT